MANTELRRALDGEVFSIDEVATAASVDVEVIRQAASVSGRTAIAGFFFTADAIWLGRHAADGGIAAATPVTSPAPTVAQPAAAVVSRRRADVVLTTPAVVPRELTLREITTDTPREPLTLMAPPRRRIAASLVVSLVFHGAFLALLIALAAIGFFNETYTDQSILKPDTARLVFLIAPGPGGGGGGGGLQTPIPPPPAKLKAPAPKKSPSPVPPVRKVVPPPRPVPQRPPNPPRIDPVIQPPVDPKPTPPTPIPPAIQAPVVPIAADPVDLAGLPTSRPPRESASNGPGTGGGIGSGTGTGLGEGQGTGIGPGSGGGTGGGPYRPGSGIEPPTLLREVRPLYTDEARRRAIEGDVQLEIVVRQDGTVGNVRVTRSLGAGLEQKAIDAVRQWRFGPARRQGSPVDVVVEVSVEFKLR